MELGAAASRLHIPNLGGQSFVVDERGQEFTECLQEIKQLEEESGLVVTKRLLPVPLLGACNLNSSSNNNA